MPFEENKNRNSPYSKLSPPNSTGDFGFRGSAFKSNKPKAAESAVVRTEQTINTVLTDEIEKPLYPEATKTVLPENRNPGAGLERKTGTPPDYENELPPSAKNGQRAIFKDSTRFVARPAAVQENDENDSASETAADYAENDPNSTGEFDEPAETRRQERKFFRPKKSKLWFNRNGHGLTYVGLFLFTFVLYFRPYELIPGMESFSSSALILAVATLVIYLPSQFSTEANLTAMPIEVCCVLLLVLFGIVTMPIAKSPTLAWDTFNDIFIKAVLMFIVMINVVRTEKRLKGILWLALSVGVMLCYFALDKFARGDFEIEGYRIRAIARGMFANPNDLAVHLVIITPIAFALFLSTQKKWLKIVYLIMTILFVAGNMVTYSRGAFLGLIVAAILLTWKLGKGQRFKVLGIGSVLAGAFIAFAPGGYGIRLLSIFIPSLDPVKSADHRRELLIQSIVVTTRNPWGIGMDNFRLMSDTQQVTHNTYTQVSAELGVLALIVYLTFLIVPFRHLIKIERELYEKDNASWIYYLAVGLQGSLAAYYVSSFFGALAYNWVPYYLIAYTVCLRNIYLAETAKKQIGKKTVGLSNADKREAMGRTFKNHKKTRL